MELPFEKAVCHYYQQKYYAVNASEETQEISIPESMPEIGHVIASWGQVILRGKDWKNGEVSVSGGAMVWVLYHPEGGGEAQKFETWIPWRKSIPIEDYGTDGTIRIECMMQSVDARSVSTRKLVVRIGVHILTQILVPQEQTVFMPGEFPEDVETLYRTYPMVTTRECGEKIFEFEEELDLPDSEGGELIYFTMNPELIDQKVMGSKTVFRGQCSFHILYRSCNHVYHSYDDQIPFAQYAELDQEYEASATVSNLFQITNLESEFSSDNRLKIRCGMVSQYTVQDVMKVTVLEDTYSPRREIDLQQGELTLPTWAEELIHTDNCVAEAELPEGTIIDLSFTPESLSVNRQSGIDRISNRGRFQILIQSQDGQILNRGIKAEVVQERRSQCQTVCFPAVKGKPDVRRTGDQWRCETQVVWDLKSLLMDPVPMVCSAAAGDMKEMDEERPAVVIRGLKESETLWDVAKSCGSTVGAIEKINHIQGNPDPERLLLIPIL